MELNLLVSLIVSLPAKNPAYMDLLKLMVGSIVWIGGMAAFVYMRTGKLKPAVSK